MSASTEHRKLAAIMFTDMVGYSAMAQLDEALALELLEEHRGIVRGILPKHAGREVKTTGDGFLIEFPSALAAVQCAVDVQAALHARNLAQPDDRQVRIRIGIHVGDVVVREGDVHGDGVNLAARIEPLAGPGGIVVSRAVHEQVGNKLEAPLARLGRAELKNIEGGLEVFRVVLPWLRGAPARIVTSRARRWRQAAPWALTSVFAVALLLVLLKANRRGSRSAEVPSIRYLTFSGRDYSPAVSVDGKRVCFSSDRKGTRQIWIKEITSGSEKALTSGPDDFPRFSRDDSAILFTRVFRARRALFRVPSLGGEERRIVDDALSGDWSPDGRQVTFIRWPEEGGSALYVSGVDGSAETLLQRFPDQRGFSPRWSPDGETIAVAINDSGRPQSLALVHVRTRQVRTLEAPHPYNQLSAAAWDGASRHLYYMQSGSPSQRLGQGTLFRQRVDSGRLEQLLWNPAYCRILDWHPSGNLVLDASSPRENLKELRLGASTNAPRSLTLGNSTDRQPAYSPDGQDVVFSSNRGGNLDLWSISPKTGVVRRLTDDPATDWDPCFSPDGKRLIWSSNRSGNLEIWIGNADGTAPVQVTRDGFSAENPTMTRDGSWIVYGSAHPQKAGIWKIHPDGTGATRLIESRTVGNAEVSPDGRCAAYVDNVHSAIVSIKVVEVESGTPVFEIPVEVLKETVVILGRVRWMPDGKTLVFLGQDARGVNGVYVQDFVPGQDTTKTRRALGPFDRENLFDTENSAESFGISPDGQFITIATWEQLFSIMKTEDLLPR
jgi:Tol biopolymer transport system component/class 3 adenylate cyclase